MLGLLPPRAGPPLGEPAALNRESGQARGLLACWPTIGNPGWRGFLAGVGAATFNGGVAPASSPTRPGLACDGVTGSYADIAYAPVFGSADFAVSLWVYKRAATLAGVFNNIFGASRWGSAAGTHEWLLLPGDGNGSTGDYPQFLVGTSVTDYAITATAQISLNAWHHILGVRRGNQIELYVDGVSAATPLAVSGSVNTGASSLKIATDDRLLSGLYTNAVFDDLRVYTRAPSAAEIWQMWAPQTRWELYRAPSRLWPTVIVSSQFARPSADVSTGGWTTESGGTTNLYASIDETSASDSDYIQSSVAPVNDEAKVRLSAVTDPAVGTGHILRFRYYKANTAGKRVDLTVTLYAANGSTVITTATYTDISAVTTGSITLTSLEADSIPGSDYATGLVLGFKATEVP